MEGLRRGGAFSETRGATHRLAVVIQDKRWHSETESLSGGGSFIEEAKSFQFWPRCLLDVDNTESCGLPPNPSPNPQLLDPASDSLILPQFYQNLEALPH